jgi:alpha-L-glutamate ligase-like protein
MNRRNADYIMRCNPRSSFPLLDDKVLTKRLAAARQIPTPPLYLLVERHGDIARFEKSLEGRCEFAVKPARGSGGSGILLIRNCTEKGFVTQSGEVLSREDLYYHIAHILSGIFSLEGLEDRAIIEGLIHPDPVFAAVSYQGVPDVRIIVYRDVPVMAMVRLPTRASDGKANLHRGAIGAGVNLRDGKTGTAVHGIRVITHHPDTKEAVSGIQIPYWENLLAIAAETCSLTGLGFIGVDLVIDEQHGPLLLELNARPGLAIQLANRHGLRKRLERVDQAPPEIFASPGTRISWARENFGDSPPFFLKALNS